MKLSVTGFIKHAIIFAMNGILPEFITYFSPSNVISYKIGMFDENIIRLRHTKSINKNDKF